MAAIKSVQRGTATVGSGVQTTTATVTAVDLAKSVLFFGLRKAVNNRPERDFFRGKFTSTTALLFGREEATGNATTIEWYVVEWDSGVTVQSGEHSGAEDTTITAVVIADSFVHHTFYMPGPTLGTSSLIKSWLSTTTNLRMEDDGSTINDNALNNWFVVESTDFVTQAGSLAVTGTTADATISAVTLAQTFPRMSWSTAGNANSDDFTLRGHFTSTTVLRAEREASTGSDLEVRWQVVDIGDGTSVESGTFAFADTDAQESATVTAVTNGLPVASGFMAHGGQSADTASDTPNYADVTLDLTTSTNLQADRGATVGTADVEWFLIDWNTGDASATVTPAVIGQAFTVDSVTVVGAAVVTPAVIARSFTVPSVTALGHTTVRPAVTSRSFTVDSVTPVGSAVALPANTARSFTVDSVTPVAPVVTTPAVTARAFTVDSVTPVGSAVALPAVTARSFTVDAATPTNSDGGAVTVEPAWIGQAFTVDSVTVVGAAVALPANIDRSFTVDAVTLVGGAVALPAVIGQAFTVDAVTAVGSAVALPAVIAQNFTVNAVTVIGGGPATVTPGVIVVVLTVDAVTTLAGATTVTPGVTARVFVIYTPLIIIPTIKEGTVRPTSSQPARRGDSRPALGGTPRPRWSG